MLIVFRIFTLESAYIFELGLFDANLPFGNQVLQVIDKILRRLLLGICC